MNQSLAENLDNSRDSGCFVFNKFPVLSTIVWIKVLLLIQFNPIGENLLEKMQSVET